MLSWLWLVLGTSLGAQGKARDKPSVTQESQNKLKARIYCNCILSCHVEYNSFSNVYIYK